MAWSQTLLPASFKGVQFDVASVTDTESRGVAVSEYPYTDGADVEDLGTNPRRIRVAAIVWGDDYESRLQALLRAVRSADPGELVHPVFGSIKRALCVQWDIDHEADLRDAVRLQLGFLEAATTQRVFATDSAVAAADKMSALGDEARAAADGELVEMVESVASGPVPTALALKGQMQAALVMLRALSDTTSTSTLPSGLDPLLNPRAYVGDARAFLDGGLAGLAFGGRNLQYQGESTSGSGTGDFERVAVSLGPAAIALTNPDANGLLVQAHARVHAACSLAEAAAIVLAGELEEALLELAELEQLAATTRAALQTALESMRAAHPGTETGAPLRALAYQVQSAAKTVIEQRPPVVKRSCPLTGPMRLVAHAVYGDHTRAPELVRLNRFGRTLVATAGEELSVYAR